MRRVCLSFSPASSSPGFEKCVRRLLSSSAVLGLAKRTGARLMFASTSEVYGDPNVHPQPESYFGNVNTLGPRACYDEGKRVAETMCYSYAREEDVEIRIARIFNTFGPRMHPNDGEREHVCGLLHGW